MKPIVSLLVGAVLAVPGTAVGQRPDAVPAVTAHAARDGEVCPAGRWYTDGGNAARNATSANPPLLRRPMVAWRQNVGGIIAGEPLVWDNRIVLAVRVGNDRRSLELRRLDDGVLLGQRTLNSRTDPWPSLWGNEVVWRVGTDELELLRFGAKSVDFVARMPKSKQVGPPLRLGTNVYAVVDGRLTCMRASDFREIWRSEAGGYAGAPSVCDTSVYALRLTSERLYVVAELDRLTGKERSTGGAMLLVKPPGDDARVLLGGKDVLVRFGPGSLLREDLVKDVDWNAVILRQPLGATEMRVLSLPIMPALDARMCIAATESKIGYQLGLFRAGREEGVRLDTCELHRSLVKVPPTIAGDVFYLGACAVDVLEFRVLWRLFRDGARDLPAVRAVPAGRSLLLAGEHELIALRENVPDDPTAAELHDVWQGGQRTRCLKLVDESIGAADWDLATELLARCRDLRIEEPLATKREKDIATGRKNVRLRADAGKAAKVRSAADAVAEVALDDVQQLVAGWASTRPALDVRHGLRFVLEQQPAHAATVALVRGMLPKDIAAPEPFHAADWLDFLSAAAHRQVTFLDAKVDEFADKSLDSVTAQNKQQLLEWRSRWRPDLQALRSDRLLLFSPISAPGSLARALATGELVCDALESMFADLPRVRHDPRPMLVFIYPDRKEYVSESKKLGFDSAEWTAGYYSDHLNELVAKSRMFVPSDDAGFVAVLPTLAHELTHQWLMDRCAAFTPDPVQARVGPRAFWIVEGFASLLEQFEFDFARNRFQLGGGGLDRVDLVASATDIQLLDWAWLTGARRMDYDRLTANQAQTAAIPSSVRLGLGFKTRRLDLFYAQAAMLCRYLYEAEDGRYRRALLDFVVAYYTGNTDKLGFEGAFGIAPKELGPKVAAYAKALLR